MRPGDSLNERNDTQSLQPCASSSLLSQLCCDGFGDISAASTNLSEEKLDISGR